MSEKVKATMCSIYEYIVVFLHEFERCMRA